MFAIGWGMIGWLCAVFAIVENGNAEMDAEKVWKGMSFNEKEFFKSEGKDSGIGDSEIEGRE